MWKTAAAGAVALVIAGSAQAAVFDMTQADYAICDKVAAAAKAIVSARQHGVPLVDLMGLGGIVSPSYTEEWQVMLQVAYDAPIASTAEGRAKAPNALAKSLYDACRENVAKAHQGK